MAQDASDASSPQVMVALILIGPRLRKFDLQEIGLCPKLWPAQKMARADKKVAKVHKLVSDACRGSRTEP